MLVDSGTTRVAMVVNTTFITIARIILIVLGFILLFWLIRALWKGQFPKSKFLRIFIPSLIVLLVGGAVYLLLAPRALASIVGEEIVMPKWEESCDDGDAYYAQFMEMYNQGRSIAEMTPVGNSALEDLNWCIYASASPEIGRAKSDMIEDITSILYPPPSVPEPVDPAELTNCTDDEGKPTWSINPMWIDPLVTIRAEHLSDMITSGKVTRRNDQEFIGVVNYKVKIANVTALKPVNKSMIVNPDFNSKYNYPVMIEENKVVRKSKPARK
jgi:hypothetical protein